jgi:hypothetical protein
MRLSRFVVLLAFTISRSVTAQEGEDVSGWSVGLQLGELPMHGSFKPGLSLGYRVNDQVYVGVVYQFRDAIRRNDTSINARSIGLEGLESSYERVGRRAYVQVRIRPYRYAPYLSVGFVFNDLDVETTDFDARTRAVGSERVEGPIRIVQSRRAGLRPALGIGYSARLSDRLEVHTEWSGWWLFGAPDPRVVIQHATMSPGSGDLLRERIISKFRSSPFNTYHIFQLGVGYRF